MNLPDDPFEKSPIREFAEEKIQKEGIYAKGYLPLCHMHDLVPVTETEFLDRYTEILEHLESLHEQAEMHQDNDRVAIFNMLQKKNGMPDQGDITLLEHFPGIMYRVLNTLPEGIIALIIVFENKEALICPAYFDRRKETMEISPELQGF